jgi:PhnB protein
MTTTPATNVMELAPYIFFYGRCEEALEFYKEAIGGTYELQRIKDSPMADQFPAEAGNNIMHATFTGAGITFLAGDGRETKQIDPDEGNIILALRASDPAYGERVFKALSEGGTIRMPFEDAFWGGKFGSLIDRFGIEWMMTTP